MNEKTEKNQYICLVVEHDKYKTLPNTKYLRRKPYEPLNKKLVTAFIPGNIKRISVQEKKKVLKGEVLLTLEAMKMNNQILAPIDGFIKKIHVRDGESVTKNQLLVEFR
ncbi:MAG TPA: acetyl-CoA carboxylase biotin carboxyl carrier protein subunit [Bacteroidales bacterium]|nr:acetyl-CoA carboxylase biotin carboxyl carrier protein subunit [Bacteroidales bacterium]HSA44374.1 acetyl-CoA carboxylase biotin carboxyl carrier protein subunit [Bacteroidales bacterium]